MIEMQVSTADVEEMTPEQCWAEIERVAEIMTIPGNLQTELKKDPQVGEEFKHNVKQVLHLIVDNFDVGVSPGESEEDRKIVHQMNELFLRNQLLQTNFTMRTLSRLSLAMQQLPLNEMILELNDVTATDGVSEAGMAELKKLETPEKGAGMAKVDPRIMEIMNLGIQAAGGQVEFAKLQHETVNRLPEEFKMIPEVAFTAQMIGAVMTAITVRSQTREFTLAQIRATIEMVIGSKQAMTLANMTAYHMSPKEVVHIMVGSAEYHINTGINSILGEPEPEEPAPKRQVKAEATHFAEAKPGAYHFEGNGTVN